MAEFDPFADGGAVAVADEPFDPFKHGGAVPVDEGEFDPFKAGAVPLDAPDKEVTPQGVVDTTHQVLNAFTGPGSIAQGNQIMDDSTIRLVEQAGARTDQSRLEPESKAQSVLDNATDVLGKIVKDSVQDQFMHGSGVNTKDWSPGSINLQAIDDALRTQNPFIKLDELTTGKPSPDAKGSGQEHQPILTLPTPQDKTVGAGITRGITNTVSQLSTPENVALMAALGGAPSVLQKAAGIGFTTQMIKGAGDQASELLDSQDMPADEKAQKITEFIGLTALAFLSGKHTFGERTRLPTGTLMPTEAPRSPAKPAPPVTQPTTMPDAVEGMLLAKEKLGENFFNQTPEVQAERRASVAEIDKQLSAMPPEAVDAAQKAVTARKAISVVPDAASENLTPEALGGEPMPSKWAKQFSKGSEQATPAVPTGAPPTPGESAGPKSSETLPPGEVSTPKATVEIDETMAKAVSDSAERIADQVTQGQPTAVREAARDAALDNGMSSLRGGKQFSVSFMRKSAQEAAGRTAGKQGESLDAPVGESEATKLDTTPTPAPPVENTELLSAMDKAIRTTLPEREAAILSGVQAGRTMETIAAEHGISTQRVSQIVKAALPKLKEALEKAGFTKDDYIGGPGAMGPIEALEMAARERETTGLKRDVVDTERLSRGAEPIPTVERQREATVVRDAEDLAATDPTATPSLVSRVVDKGETAVTEKEAALLLVDRARLMNERAQWEERLGDKDQVETARTRLTEIENEMNRLDIAQRAIGTTWGRLGHMYQRMIRDDFTLEALERKFRAAKLGPLTEAERAKLKAQSEQIAELQKQVDEERAKFTEDQLSTETTRILEETINFLGKSHLEKPGYGKQVFDIARTIVERWKAEAVDAAAELKQQLGSESGAIGGSGSSKGRGKFIGQQNASAKSSVVVNLAKVFRAKVGEFGLSKVEAFADVLSEYGPKVKPHLDAAWGQMGKLISAEKMPDKAREVTKGGVSKKNVKTPVEAAGAAKAEAVAGEELSHKTAYETVEAVINGGTHGEGPVFAEAHKILKESFPDLTERDVRRAYTEYGKAKFPSKDATKVELAELRRLGQLQESIDRIQKDALDPLKSGLQRNKASLAVREKTKLLNEFFKKREGAPSPEKLASRDQAKQTALKNRIEELDKQLKTGEKPVKSGTAPDSAATEQLRAERDAMVEKLREIQEAENPGKTVAQKQVDALAKVRDRLSDTLSGKRPENAPKDWNPLSAAAEDLKAEIQGMQELAAQLKRDAKPPTDPNAAAEKTHIRVLEDAIRKYEDKIAKGDFSSSGGRKFGPDTEKVTALREIRDARKAAYDAAKKAGQPVLTPEERYNATRLKAVQKRIGDLEAKLKANDFTRPSKKMPPVPTKELQEAQVKLARVRKEINSGIEQERLKNRTPSQKFWDHFVGIERAMKLSSDVVLAKLGTAAFTREFVLTPAEQLVGGAFSAVERGVRAGVKAVTGKNYKTLSEMAPIEGGLSFKAEAKAKVAMFTKGLADAANNLKMKQSNLEAMYGKDHGAPSWYEYFGFLHAAMKAPVKRAAFTRSMEYQMEHFIREGGNPNNLDAVGAMAERAYIEANRAIFMQDNVVATGMNAMLRALENNRKFPNAGPALSRTLQFLVPIVKVPTNIVGEALTGVHGVGTGGVQALRAYIKGVEKLPPEQADMIMRNLKKGLVGNAFLLTGYFAYKSIGGFYQDRENRSESDVQPEHYKVGGVDLPGFVSHTNAAILMNAGATYHRQQDKKKSVLNAGGAAGVGVLRQLPFVPAMTQAIDASKSGEGFEKYMEQLLVSSTVPALVGHAAKVIDTPGKFPQNALKHPNKRYPKNIKERYEEKLPGLRSKVPGHR